MKLVGEYELTDEGVVIEGKINNSHIYEVRQLLKPLKEFKMYHGEKPKGHDSPLPLPLYAVPHNQYRSYVINNVPGVITPEIEREYVTIEKNFKDDNNQIYYRDTITFHNNLGIMYGEGEGRAIMDERPVLSYLSMRRNKTRLLTNSAWVWNVDKDGAFRIELQGLVNRHMMTVVLENATKLARYIDGVLVKCLDHPEKFAADQVGKATRQEHW